MRTPGPLLASGRDSDIFECGPKLVLKWSRHGRSMATEARTMEHARARGYPVPAVEEISDDGTDLVMARLAGASMVDVLSRRPWTIRQQAAVLADLHRRLHDIPAPDWLSPAPCGEGDRLLHLDLHPLNIVLTDERPVVIDWPNAARGDGPVDVALTWVLMVSGGIPFGRVKAAVMGLGRSLFVNRFLRDFDLTTVRPHLADVVAWKVKDPNMTEIERQAMRHLARTSGTA
jgi:aminoglycoside phosphotransferase (APT) family kinase protein